MLSQLRIKNLALVEHIALEFQPGLNMITGETGAGKSILIGALGLLLGERADKSLIRAGEDACGAEAVFELAAPAPLDALLEECGLEPCDAGQLVLRRIVKATGAGQVLVNDSPVTLQVLKRLGELLVDMHGPHDHQSLLNTDAQLDILDAFGHLWPDRAAYEQPYDELRKLETRRQELLGAADDDVDMQIDLLRHRVKDIEDARLEEGEEEKIRQEHSVVGNAQRILELGSEIVHALSEGEASAFEQLAGMRRAMDELSRLMPEAEAWSEESDELTKRLQELGAAMSSKMADVEAEPARLEWLDQRLALYASLKRKYGPGLGDILAKLDEARGRLRDLETRGEQLAALNTELKTVRTRVEQEGAALHERRGKASNELAESITEALRALGFGHGSFSVELTKTEPARSGTTGIEFAFAPNVGEPGRPLRAIASSGEISRVMLAVKAVLAAHDRIPLLVFDEIDANLGGEMGHAVGGKLAEVAANHQVICITHLPQVAVFGTTHIAVAKEVRDGRTVTTVVRLEDPDARANEVARMLAGDKKTDVSLQHAREMLGDVRRKA